MALRVAIYTRVSTDAQTTENQRHAILAAVEQRRWTVVQEFTDEGISGAKGRDQRPGLDAMLKETSRGRFDVIAAWSVDRLGRSLVDLLGILNGLNKLNVNLYLHQQALDTTTPSGRAMFQMIGVFAEFERAMIQERVNAGLARARAGGTRLGRPPTITEEMRDRIKTLRAQRVSVIDIAEELDVHPRTVRRALQKLPSDTGWLE
jgi:DNA invertase Pin-like site-specific DNA recombinase